MAVASIQVSETPLVLYALRRADDALVLGHRLSEWCGHAPMLEEDMALANMALDLLGQARELYSYAAKVEGRDNDEDKFAYLRGVRQYRNLLLLEQPNGDFARTMVRQFFYAAFADLDWRAMMKSKDSTLAAIAAKVIMTPTTVPSSPRNGPPEIAMVSTTIRRLSRCISLTTPLSSDARMAAIDAADSMIGLPPCRAKRWRISAAPMW